MYLIKDSSKCKNQQNRNEQERQNGLTDVSVKYTDFQAQFRDFIGEMLL